MKNSTAIKRVLVTGGAGFIGSHLAESLIKIGMQVTVVDNLTTGRSENVPPKSHFYKLGIESPKLLTVFTQEKPEIVFHLAALTETDVCLASILEDIKINLLGTLNTLKAACQVKCKKFIFTSTGAVYGDIKYLPIPENSNFSPISPYGVGKLTCENYVRMFYDSLGLKFTILRYANVYGPRQFPKAGSGAIPIFIKKMLAGETPFIYGSGKQIRDYAYVKDVVDASIKAINNGDEKIINISTQKGTSTRQLYKIMAELLNFKPAPKFTDGRSGEIVNSILSNKAAKKYLNWRPKTELKNGLRQTIKWWKENNWSKS